MGLFIRSRRRLTAFCALALLACVQVVFASAGCIGTRATMVQGLNDAERCPIEQLVCHMHCQAEAQSVDQTGVAVPPVGDAPPHAMAVPMFLPAGSNRSSRVDAGPPPGTPPPRLLFQRFLN